MADYFVPLASAVRSLAPFTAEARRSFFERAWSILEEQLRDVQPPLSDAELEAERRTFDEAVREANAAYPLPPPGRSRLRLASAESHARHRTNVEAAPFQLFAQFTRRDLPALTIKTILEFGGRTTEGRLVEAVTTLWFEILERFRRNPSEMYQVDPHIWEEIIAGAY